MSTPRNPFDEMERFFERMSDQFDEAALMWDTDGPLRQWSGAGDAMAMDMVDRDDEYVVTVDLPGFERDDVAIKVTDHTLHVAAEHDEEHEEARADYLRRERRHEATDRSIRLPGEVDTEAVEARMQNGVLTITLPKLDAETAHTIEIEE